MIVGERLRQIREEKKLSQGDIERKTGLLRCYISRVENGHTVPSVETLQKFAQALDVPMYHLFYEGDNPPVLPKLKTVKTPLWGSSGKEARLIAKFRRLLSRTGEDDRKLLLHTARKMADHKPA